MPETLRFGLPLWRQEGQQRGQQQGRLWQQSWQPAAPRRGRPLLLQWRTKMRSAGGCCAFAARGKVAAWQCALAQACVAAAAWACISLPAPPALKGRIAPLVIEAVKPLPPFPHLLLPRNPQPHNHPGRKQPGGGAGGRGRIPHFCTAAQRTGAAGVPGCSRADWLAGIESFADMQCPMPQCTTLSGCCLTNQVNALPIAALSACSCRQRWTARQRCPPSLLLLHWRPHSPALRLPLRGSLALCMVPAAASAPAHLNL